LRPGRTKLIRLTALEWEGCVNVRDLGGLPTEDGRRTRRHSVVRADNIRRLTDEGWHALEQHGVTRIVDLRFPEELAQDPPRDVDVEVVHVSLLGAGFGADPEYVRRLDAHLDAVDDAADHHAWSYVDFLERYRDRFGLAVAAIADAPAGVVVFHCAGGKDRTGLVAALLLRLAGVARDEIGADYARSGANLAPLFEAWLAGVDDELLRRRGEKLSRTPPEAMVRVLEEIERRYGDVAGYLRAAGVTEEQLERLRERLREAA
jgi:protein tyrosine/serine phosphatase